jgi:hypothetical protein
MENLFDLGIFFVGVGVLLLGSGLMWFISEWSSMAKARGKETS